MQKKKNRSQVYSFRRNVRFFGTNFLVSTLMVSNLLAAIDIVSTKVMTSIVRTIPSKYARLCITGEMCTKSADQSKGHFIRAVGSFMQMNTNTIQYTSNEYKAYFTIGFCLRIFLTYFNNFFFLHARTFSEWHTQQWLHLFSLSFDEKKTHLHVVMSWNVWCAFVMSTVPSFAIHVEWFQFGRLDFVFFAHHYVYAAQRNGNAQS